MSSWGKFLAPITVPTGGWAFVWRYDDGETATNITETIPAATYDTYLHLMATLEGLIDGAYSPDITVSSVGITTITIGPGDTYFDSVVFASCADDLMTVMGFAETETVSSAAISTTNPHTYGWYPGVISLDSSNGEGLSSDSGWIGEDVTQSALAGNGAMRIIAPSRHPYRRRLRFANIHRDERYHSTRGCARFQDQWRTKNIYWYPDRDDGNVGSYGTQGDPGPTSYNNDKDLDEAGAYYWLVTIADDPRFSDSGTHPDYFILDLTLNAEPT